MIDDTLKQKMLSLKDNALIFVSERIKDWESVPYAKKVSEKERQEEVGREIFFHLNIIERTQILRLFSPQKEGINSFVRKKQERKKHSDAFIFIYKIVCNNHKHKD